MLYISHVIRLGDMSERGSSLRYTGRRRILGVIFDYGYESTLFYLSALFVTILNAMFLFRRAVWADLKAFKYR